MPSKRRMRGGTSLLGNTDSGTTDNTDSLVDSKKLSRPSKVGGRRRRRRSSRSRGSRKARRSRRGGNILGTALLPFGLLWGQKSYQNRGSRRGSRKTRRRRRHRRRR